MTHTNQTNKLRPDEIAFWGRFVSKIKDPEDEQDAATKKYVDEHSGGGGTTYTAGDNITISNNVISATDTTYSNFTGTDGVDAGAAGLVPAPAVSDAEKYLKADGTWADVEGGGVITLKYSDYNPTLVTTPQPLGKFLYESGVKTGDTVVIENDTNETFMYIVATEGVSYDFTIKTVPCYIVNNNEEYDGSATYFQFYINISGISYKWNYYISGSNYRFGSETVISSNNVKPYGGDYYDPYDVLSAGSGNALSTLVQVATNITGLSPVEGTFSGLGGFITCDQQMTPGEPEWIGEMEVASTTPYNFETASVGTSIYVYVRSDAGLPLYYSPTDWADPFQITDTSGNTIEVSEYIISSSTGQPTSDYVNFVPGKYIMLQKFSNGWGFTDSATDAQYLPRTIATS